ncbi:dienelactone hydrolase family protein [Marivibrio halodurans]|uniref:Dienelactone hydrolase family protein n=1 Tax=Marivibrio halodurans TaxID=2039722 RepID=A0A8J7V478_9PROT|nr:alpha/beta family hydrolase [Marivibrio halodurans]MBP5857389.1 dienelactone hydrolase family protein [Marivibrio halodurans]
METTARNWLFDGPEDATWCLCLAHGAGAPMDSAFMTDIAARIAAHGIRVIRFEFPYMVRRRLEGTRRPPDRQPVLLDAYRTVVHDLRANLAGPASARLAIGGKSMGGRMASLIAAETGVNALICLGYPFHPPGKPERTRTAHLETLRTPTLICQGERDPFGRREEVEGYALSPHIDLFWAPDGDHDLAPRKKSGLDHADTLNDSARTIAEFLKHFV